MKILLCHNFYQQAGGEDQVFADEAGLLEAHGHQVLRYTRHNDDIAAMGRWDLARRTLWNRQTVRELGDLIRREQPALMHCTNTFPLISPAAYDVAQRHGVAVVQSLHNYRLVCPAATLLRDGQVCEDCLGKSLAWPAVRHGCYRDNRAATAVVALSTWAHRLQGTWTHSVDRYIALTEFARNKLIAGGLPAEKIAVKPNFVQPDPGSGSGRGGYAIFVGRLSVEKGIETLLAAWRELPLDLPLWIVGDGPLRGQVEAAADRDRRIRCLGWRSLDEVCSLVGDAACLLMTSIWYETFGRTMIEAFAKGTPVIASRLGAMGELVDNGRTGLHFAAGDAADLADKVAQLVSDPNRLPAMRKEARREYEDRYTPAANYDLLMQIYDDALRAQAGRRSKERQHDVSSLASQTPV